MQSTTIRQRMGEVNMGQIFDTLKYTKRALAAGFSQQQAEFQAEELATIINDSLVTKDYFNTELHRQLTDLEIRLTWRIIGSMAVLLTMAQVVGHFFK